MELQTIVVVWTTHAPDFLPPDACQVVCDALRVSAWRAGGSVLACRVTHNSTRMVAQIPVDHDTRQFIVWVRAATRFAVARVTNGPLPQWDDAYTYYGVNAMMVADEIAHCFTMPPIPAVPLVYEH